MKIFYRIKNEKRNKKNIKGIYLYNFCISPKCKTEPKNDTAKKRNPIVFVYCVDDFVQYGNATNPEENRKPSTDFYAIKKGKYFFDEYQRV